MKSLKSILSIILAMLLLVGAFPFGGIIASANTGAHEEVELVGGRINLAVNGDFEDAVLSDSAQKTVKSKNGEEKVTVQESDGNRYLVMPPRDGQEPGNGYDFQQTFVGLNTSKSYTLSFRFKTENTKSSWAFMVGLFDNVATLGTNPYAPNWQYITPTSVSVTTGGATYINEASYGGIITDITSTDWQTVKMVFTPKNAWTSLVFHPYIAEVGKVCVDDIVLSENTAMVYNGDFEDDQDVDFGFDYGKISRGITLPENITMPYVVESSVCGGNGSYSLYVPGYTYVMQEIPYLEIGKTYRYSYNLYLPDGAPNEWTLMSGLQKSKPSAPGNLYENVNACTRQTSSGLTVINGYGGIISNAAAATWYTVTETFTATTTSAYIYILSWYGKDSYFDDFSLVEVSDGNYIVNGDFEDANYNGFNTNNAKLVSAKSVGASGNYVLYLPNDGTTKSQAWQMVTGLTAGQKYYFTYKVKFATKATGWTLFADIYNYRPLKLTNPTKTNITRKAYNITDGFNIEDSYYGFVESSGNSYSTEWQKIIIPFTANASVAYINFYHFSNNVSDVYIDDVSVVGNNKIVMSNGDFSDGIVDYAVSDNTACVVSNYDENHGNVVTIPKSAKENVNARKLSKAIVGLTVGEAYSLKFDLKLDNYESPNAMEWLALAGVSNVKPSLNGNGAHYYNVAYPEISSFFCQSSVGAFNKNLTDDLFGYIQYNGSTDWLTYEMRFVAETETVYFYIENVYGKADLVLDNITIGVAEAVSSEINYTPAAENEETTSVMIMGNSFSQDTMREVQDIINAGSADLRMAMFGKGAKNYDYFYQQYLLDDSKMEFWYAEKDKSGQTLIQLSDTSFDAAFNFLDWDYVVLQATTGGSDILAENYNIEGLNRFIDVLKSELPDTEIILYVPWAYSQDYINSINNGYTTVEEQIAAYEAYEAYIAEQTGCRIISAVSAIENTRNIEGIGANGTTRDGYHMNAIGATAVGLKFYEYFTGVDVRTLDYTKTYFPYDASTNSYTGDLGTEITEEQLMAIKAGVHATFVDYITGDATDDQQIDIRDLVAVKKYIVEINVDINDVAGDIDLSGIIDGDDLVKLRAILLSK